MPSIKIQLEREELDAVKRRADELGVTVQQLAYGALNCSMHHIKSDGSCRVRIGEAVHERGPGRNDLPLWSDSARSVAVYESKPDIHSSAGPEGGPLPKKA
jgi:hypothetical protein